jgi:hypothetical protein
VCTSQGCARAREDVYAISRVQLANHLRKRYAEGSERPGFIRKVQWS